MFHSSLLEKFILASLAGMIPLLPGGLGAVDGIMIIFYSAAGITASISAAATVIERLISFWMATIIGLLFLPMYGSSILDESMNKLSENEDKLEESNADLVKDMMEESEDISSDEEDSKLDEE